VLRSRNLFADRRFAMKKSILAILIAGLAISGVWAAPVEEEAAMAEE
jgi:hypothetical protein